MKITQDKLTTLLLTSFKSGFSTCHRLMSDPQMMNKSEEELKKIVDETMQTIIVTALTNIKMQ